MQTTEGEKIFAMHITQGNVSFSEYIKNSYKSIEKTGKTWKQPFTKKDIQITNKHKNLLKLISYQGGKN